MESKFWLAFVRDGRPPRTTRYFALQHREFAYRETEFLSSYRSSFHVRGSRTTWDENRTEREEGEGGRDSRLVRKTGNRTCERARLDVALAITRSNGRAAVRLISHACRHSSRSRNRRELPMRVCTCPVKFSPNDERQARGMLHPRRENIQLNETTARSPTRVF